MTGLTGACVHVHDLTITRPDGQLVLRGVNLAVPDGEALAVVGESGAGKTTLALALLGHLPPPLRRVHGEVIVAGQAPLTLDPGALRAFRRRRTAWLGQDPAASLTPTLRVGDLVGEPLTGNRKAARVAVREALTAVGLPDDDDFARRYPHEISGGQRRRVALARALARRPQVLVLDEPVAGLDSRTRERTITEIDTARRAVGCTLVLISHDLVAVRELTDQMLVLHDGEVAEAGPTAAILTAPTARTTRAMLEADTATELRPPPAAGSEPRLAATGLCATHPPHPPVFDGVSLSLAPGECVAVTGPSGIGKSTLARCLVGLHVPARGRVELSGTVLAPGVLGRSAAQRRAMGYVPQDPATSLNPAWPVGSTLTRALRHGGPSASRQWPRGVTGLLKTVGLAPATADRWPAALSGGQRQRVSLARALASSPMVLICDEVTSALDATAAADVLDLLDRLRREQELSILLITHDRSPVGRVAGRCLGLGAAGLVMDDLALSPDLGGACAHR